MIRDSRLHEPSNQTECACNFFEMSTVSPTLMWCEYMSDVVNWICHAQQTYHEPGNAQAHIFPRVLTIHSRNFKILNLRRAVHESIVLTHLERKFESAQLGFRGASHERYLAWSHPLMLIFSFRQLHPGPSCRREKKSAPNLPWTTPLHPREFESAQSGFPAASRERDLAWSRMKMRRLLRYEKVTLMTTTIS